MSRTRTLPSLVALLVTLAGCGPPATTDVLQLTDLDPRQVEVGDRIEIAGENLPAAADIARIEVTLRGVLARPGRASCGSPVEVTVSDPPAGAQAVDLATGASRDVTYAERTARIIELSGARGLSFVVTEEMLASLAHCPGERMRRDGAVDVPHATLALGAGGGRGVGGVTVRVFGLTSGRAVAGTLRGPTLDLLASPSSRLLLDPGARHAAERALDFMGIVLATSHPTEGGLRVASVRPGSPADRAGIASNDVLARLDGATVLGLDDFRPATGSRDATVAVLRGEVLDERVVSLEGLTPDTPVDIAFASVLLGVVALWLAFALAPRPAIVAWLASRLRLERQRGPRHANALDFARWIASSLRPAQRDAADGDARVVPWLACAMVVTMLLVVPCASLLASSDVEIGTLFGLVILGRTLARGSSGSSSSLFARLGRALRATIGRVPTLVALASVVATAGSFKARAIVASQGGAPWEWHAFRHPALFALCGLFAASSLVEPTSRTRSTPWLALEQGHVFVSGLLGSIAFLGGWQLPGIALAEQDGSAFLQMAGAAALLAKTWACVFAALQVRWAMPRLRVATLLASCWRHVVALLVVASGGTIGWILVAPRLPVAAAWAASVATFALVALSAGWLLVRRHVAVNGTIEPVMPALFPALVSRHDSVHAQR